MVFAVATQMPLRCAVVPLHHRGASYMPFDRGFVDFQARRLNHTSANARIILEKTCEFVDLVFAVATQIPYRRAVVLLYHWDAAYVQFGRGFVDLRAPELNHTSANAGIIREKTCEFVDLVFAAATQVPCRRAAVLLYHRDAAYVPLARDFVDLWAPKLNHTGANARITRGV